MSRAVTGDHVMFNESIPLFRPEKIETKETGEQLVGYLLLDFSLNETLDFSYFRIDPTIEVELPGAYSAFISPVKLPNWFEKSHNAHLFTIGLAAVFSFVSGRPVKAPRDGYLTYRKQLDEYSLSQLALQFPVLTAGPGAHDTRLSHKGVMELYEKLQEMIQILFSAPYKLYVVSMQSIRLVQLAHLNKRDDFGLAYYLLVSSIEPFATKAIKRKEVVEIHPMESKWKEIGKTNQDFENLLSSYLYVIKSQKLIGKRFVEFVMKYCPSDQWIDLKHPQENSSSYYEELTGDNHHGWITKKQWYEIYPEDLTNNEIRKLLKDLYDHRSGFTHEGRNPPHRDPNSHNRFFDIETVIKTESDDFRIEEIVLPNYQLISFISKRSIINYLKQKVT
jgi:hypothetical protein